MKQLLLCIFLLNFVTIVGDEQPKSALIFGITGQDGSYLAELLLKKGYTVYGVKRRASSYNTGRIDHIYQDPHLKDRCFILEYGDVTDTSNVFNLIAKYQPDEIYNLAAQSHVRVSFDEPEYTAETDALGTLRILEAIRILGLEKKTKFYQASTSELYGKVQETPQTEKTPFYPRSPYAIAKLYAFWITKEYRDAYGIFACNGILFNHESPRRGETFVTRKITMGIARIMHGTQDCLYLGNLNAKRDWGHARDYVEAMWLMLQHETPDDFVISTGETHSVKEFLEKAFKVVGIEIVWEGEGVDEVGFNAATGKPIVKVDPVYFRPTEVDLLLGNPSKAQEALNWKHKISFEQLVEEMVKADMEALK